MVRLEAQDGPLQDRVPLPEERGQGLVADGPLALTFPPRGGTWWCAERTDHHPGLSPQNFGGQQPCLPKLLNFRKKFNLWSIKMPERFMCIVFSGDGTNKKNLLGSR